MTKTWAEQYVDRTVDGAWLAFRMHLADRLLEGDGEAVEITGPAGQVLTIEREDEHHVVRCGDDVVSTSNADEAAFRTFAIVHDGWQVVHPTFLDTDLVEVPQVDEKPRAVVVPTLGTAESQEQLQSWVEATFQERMSEPLKVGSGGRIWWRTTTDKSVSVRVCNAGRIEISVVLARQVGFGKARRAMDRLSRRYFGLKFRLEQDRLVMSQTLIAQPFVPEQLHAALRTFIRDTDRLVDVAEEVLSKRARADRARVEEAEKALAAAEAQLAKVGEELKTIQRRAEWRGERLRDQRANSVRLRAERDAARAELARLRELLTRALGQGFGHDITTCRGMGSSSGEVA